MWKALFPVGGSNWIMSPLTHHNLMALLGDKEKGGST
jgi:hypothetical protein